MMRRMKQPAWMNWITQQNVGEIQPPQIQPPQLPAWFPNVMNWGQQLGSKFNMATGTSEHPDWKPYPRNPQVDIGSLQQVPRIPRNPQVDIGSLQQVPRIPRNQNKQMKAK